MALFSFDIDEILNVVSTIAKQADVGDTIVNGIKNGLNPIMGGAWVGQGANAFVQEVTTEVIPQIQKVIAAITGYGGGVNQAGDIIQQADDVITGIINGLGDIFDAIF